MNFQTWKGWHVCFSLSKCLYINLEWIQIMYYYFFLYFYCVYIYQEWLWTFWLTFPFQTAQWTFIMNERKLSQYILFWKWIARFYLHSSCKNMNVKLWIMFPNKHTSFYQCLLINAPTLLRKKNNIVWFTKKF